MPVHVCKLITQCAHITVGLYALRIMCKYYYYADIKAGFLVPYH